MEALLLRLFLHNLVPLVRRFSISHSFSKLLPKRKESAATPPHRQGW